MANHQTDYLVEPDALADDTPCQCDLCDWTGPLSALGEIERAILTSGSEVPAGRCPNADCYALAYIVPAPKADENRTGAVFDMLRKLATRVLDDADNTPYDTAQEAMALIARIEAAPAPRLTVYTLTIDHKHGADVRVFRSEEGALDALAAWAREWWNVECRYFFGALSEEAFSALSDDKAIKAYFSGIMAQTQKAETSHHDASILGTPHMRREVDV